MPSTGDLALIALLALLLFGPKKLPELARQLGKLMGEFRRASNEFRMQMEDELRIAEQEEQRNKIAAMEAAAPKAPPLLREESTVVDQPQVPVEGDVAAVAENTIAAPADAPAEAPLPIASSGELDMMPPSTGLPVSRSASSSPLSPMLDSIPHTADPETAAQPPAEHSSHEAPVHG